MLVVAEVLRDRESRETDAQSGARGLIHLAEDHRHLLQDAGLLHLAEERGALARALANAAEHRVAGVLDADVADELGDDDGLADAGAAEHGGLTALEERADQVDDLDARLEDLG